MGITMRDAIIAGLPPSTWLSFHSPTEHTVKLASMASKYEPATLHGAPCLSHAHFCFPQAMSYRSGHHSTSDDSSRYRTADEMKQWRARDPVMRFQRWLVAQQWWEEGQEQELRKAVRKEVRLGFRGQGWSSTFCMPAFDCRDPTDLVRVGPVGSAADSNTANNEAAVHTWMYR